MSEISGRTRTFGCSQVGCRRDLRTERGLRDDARARVRAARGAVSGDRRPRREERAVVAATGRKRAYARGFDGAVGGKPPGVSRHHQAGQGGKHGPVQ